MLLGLSSILSLNESQLPISIKDSLFGICKYLVQLTSEIIEIREKGEKEDKEEQEAAEDVAKF